MKQSNHHKTGKHLEKYFYVNQDSLIAYNITLKNVKKTYESLNATSRNASKVENPPLKTAVPMVLIVSTVLLLLSAALVTTYVTPICAE